MHECNLHQLMLTVKKVDKYRATLLGLLAASLPGCHTASSMELCFVQRAMHA